MSAPDPLALFREWFAAAEASGAPLPDAMTLATADPGARPSARTVLLKALDGRGFVFFTNYESRKGRELQSNPRGALVFVWHMEPRRQVLVQGRVERVPQEESEAYFATRPRGSRLAAAGYLVLRFTADDVLRRPQYVIATVRAALAARV